MRIGELPTPCFLVDEERIIHNLSILRGLEERTGAKVLLAQKAFSMYRLYPLIGRYLSGTTASGLYEARLGAEEMGGETHIFSPAYRAEEMPEIIALCDHIVFNHPAEVRRYAPAVRAAGKRAGLRINPECSTQEGHAIYDPCAPNSRMGTTAENFEPDCLDLIDGLHFHTLCEQDADDLATTLDAVEEKFGAYLPRMRWLNFGGGHHITRPGYQMDVLEDCIRRMQEKYGVTVYLEPGEAVALNAGFLITSVLSTLRNGMDIAILDTSAACHMPDVLEMPYRPPLEGAGKPGEKPYTYRLGGPTCLAGDIIGDYAFDAPLSPGDRLTFGDMAIYSMVKTNTFNGMALPTIALRTADGDCQIVRRFDYSDFKTRLS